MKKNLRAMFWVNIKTRLKGNIKIGIVSLDSCLKIMTSKTRTRKKKDWLKGKCHHSSKSFLRHFKSHGYVEENGLVQFAGAKQKEDNFNKLKAFCRRLEVTQFDSDSDGFPNQVKDASATWFVERVENFYNTMDASSLFPTDDNAPGSQVQQAVNGQQGTSSLQVVNTQGSVTHFEDLDLPSDSGSEVDAALKNTTPKKHTYNKRYCVVCYSNVSVVVSLI